MKKLLLMLLVLLALTGCCAALAEGGTWQDPPSSWVTPSPEPKPKPKPKVTPKVTKKPTYKYIVDPTPTYSPQLRMFAGPVLKTSQDGYLYDIVDGKLTIFGNDRAWDWDTLEIPEVLYDIFGNEIGKVEAIHDSSFSQCNRLRKVFIPDTVLEIGGGAFWSCENLEEVRLPKNLGKIEMLTFRNCRKLKKIDIPKSVKVIEEKAFASCVELEEVILHSGLEEIVYDAFDSCINLEKIAIPDSVKKIEVCAFRGCEKLKIVVLPDRDIWIEQGAFPSNKDLTLQVYPNSDAHEYAMKNNIPFVLIGAKAAQTPAPKAKERGVLRVHYRNRENAYKGLGIWFWGDVKKPSVKTGPFPVGLSVFPEENITASDAFLDIALAAPARQVVLLLMNTKGIRITPENLIIDIPFTDVREVWINEEFEISFEAPPAYHAPEMKTAEMARATDKPPEGRTIDFYSEPDGRGTPVTRGEGFTAFYFDNMGFDNDALSSVRINADGLFVRLYEHSEFSGSCLVLQGKGLYNLRELQFDNICSSYVISK